MLESMLYIQGKVLPKTDITFRTSSTTATTITTSGLGPGFKAQYSVDGSALTPADTSFRIPAGEHEVMLKLTVTTGTYLTMLPFKDILTEVTDWEDFQLPLIRFDSCAKLTKVPDYLPVAITNMQYMFDGCTSFNQDIGNWNVGNVTNMNGMFRGCASFNQDIDQWDTGNVTNMSYMFRGCSSFNQDISQWDVSNVTDMNSMFYNCTSFNQDIGSWDTGKVTDMAGMFLRCTSFNQDISRWNVSQVTSINNMFLGCTSFNQDLSSMVFKSTVTRTAYDQGASAWLTAYRPQFTG